MFIDTHCHLDDERYSSVENVVNTFVRDGVDFAINMGCSYSSSERGKELSEQFKQIYFCAGFHPSDVDLFDNELEKTIPLLDHEKCLGIGEIGLDYYWKPFDKEKQIKCFVSQLELANYKKLPVCIHSREATGDMINILKQNKNLLTNGGVMHCFSGSVETAKELMDIGLYISFAGPITFKNAGKLLEVAKYVPLEYCLTETDSPYLAPHPLRGSVNEPKNVALICAFLAQLKNIEIESFAKSIMDNAKRLFKKLK